MPTRSVSLVLVLLLGQSVAAQTWIGATSGDWNTPSNWSGNTIPQAGAVVVMDSATANSTVTPQGLTSNPIDTLRFSGTGLPFMTLQNGTITMQGSNLVEVNTSHPNADETVSMNIVMNGAGTLRSIGAGDLGVTNLSTPLTLTVSSIATTIYGAALLSVRGVGRCGVEQQRDHKPHDGRPDTPERLAFNLRMSSAGLTNGITYTRTLITYGSLSNLSPGTYNAQSPGGFTVTTDGVGGFQIPNDWSITVGSGTIDLTFTAIPEPSFVLALAGGLGLIRMRKKPVQGQ